MEYRYDFHAEILHRESILLFFLKIVFNFACLTLKTLDTMNLKYLFFNGKNAKLPYYIKSYLHFYLPAFPYRLRLRRVLGNGKKRPDYADLEAIRSLTQATCQSIQPLMLNGWLAR